MPFVRDDTRQFLDFLNSQPGGGFDTMDPPTARAMMATLSTMCDTPVGDLAVIRDMVAPGPAGDIPLRLFDARADRGAGPVLLFIHGGGWVIGTIDVYASLCAEIARQTDLPVVSVEYRLAPEHLFPAAPDDCEAAARWVASSPDALGLDVTGLVIAGDSAGGNLTIVTTHALLDTPAAVPVIAQWPIYPAVDGAGTYASADEFNAGYLLEGATMEWFLNHYQGDASSPRLSPLQAVRADTPPTLVITAGLDPLRDQGRAYVAALAERGVTTSYREARGNIHGFITLRQAIPSGQKDLADCIAALNVMVAEAVVAL